MNSTAESQLSEPLPPGTQLANHTIHEHVASTPLGERYVSVYGKTTHYVDLIVAPAENADAFRAFLAKVSPVRQQPCLCHFFDAGFDQATGLAWLRCTHVDGCPIRIFHTELDEEEIDFPEAAWFYYNSQTETSPRLENLANLLAVAPDSISEEDSYRIAGDILEAVATLHEAGLHAGAEYLTPEGIYLDRLRHARAHTARISLYALEETTPALQKADFPALAAVLRSLYAATEVQTRWFDEFIDALAQQRFASMQEAFEAFREKLPEINRFPVHWSFSRDSAGGDNLEEKHKQFAAKHARGKVRLSLEPSAASQPAAAPVKAGLNLQLRPDDSFRGSVRGTGAPEKSVNVSLSLPKEEEGQVVRRRAASSHSHRTRRRSAPSKMASLSLLIANASEAQQRFIGFMRMAFVFAIVVGLGYGAWFYIQKNYGAALVQTNLQQQFDSFSSVRIISTRENAGDVMNLAGLNALEVFSADEALLEKAARSGSILAAAALSVRPVMEYDSDEPLPDRLVARCMDLFTAIAEPLYIEAEKNEDAAVLAGYGNLLGLHGGKVDTERAYRYLNLASNKGSWRASELLGDWYAGMEQMAAGVSQERSERDRMALDLYRKALQQGQAAEKAKLSLAQCDRLRTNCITLIRLNRGLVVRDSDYYEFVQTLARLGCVPAMALLAEGSPLFTNHTEQNRIVWIRSMANAGQLPPAVRAWAQVRLAERFASGEGAMKSDVAAKIWYTRAADAGNKQAIQTLIEWCASGRGSDSLEPDPAASAKWKEKLASAQDEHRFYELLGSPLTRTSSRCLLPVSTTSISK